MRKEELENRLIDFSVSVSVVCQSIQRSELGRHVCVQLIRSSVSSALNYGEAQGAESTKDFVHKLRISLKELRESFVSLRIIDKAGICRSNDKLLNVIDECNQLISIFVISIRTTEKKDSIKTKS